MAGLGWLALHEKLVSLHAAACDDDMASWFERLLALLQAALSLREEGAAATPSEVDAALLFRQLMGDIAADMVGAREESQPDACSVKSSRVISLIWRGIFREHTLKSKSLAVMQAAALLNGYRPLANFFGQKIGDIASGLLLPRKWLPLVTGALLMHARAAAHDSAARVVLCDIMEPGAMPVDAIWATLEHMSVDDDSTIFFVETVLPSEWSYASALLIMRRSRSCRDFFEQRPALGSLLRRLFLRAMAETSFQSDLLREVVMKKPYDFPYVCDPFISILPEPYVATALSSAAILWGNRLFVSRGDDDMQDYLTRAILSFLKRSTDRSSLETIVGDSHAPAAALLSEGIAVYFDANKKSSRLCGMRVASAFARAMGGEVVFDELLRHEQQQSAEPAAAEPAIASRPRSPSAASDHSSTTSGGSDLEAYDFNEESDPQRTVSYLRSCLELLRASEASPDAYDSHRCGLASVPAVVAQFPLDGGMVSGHLVRELLRMPNSFNMEDFTSMHSSALDSLFKSYPEQAIAAAAVAMESDEMHVGGKLTALCAAVRAAFALSGLELDTADKKGGGEAVVVLGKEEEVDRAAGELSSLAALKTRVRRPAMLALRSKKKVFFRNGFAPVATSFYAVVARVLVLYSRRRFGLSGGSVEAMIASPEVFASRAVDTPNAGISEHFSSSSRNELADVVDSIMVSQSLLTIAGFTRCTLNCREQERYIAEALRLAAPHLKAQDESVRRSALTASLSAVESCLQMCTESGSMRSTGAFREGGALESLSSLSSLSESAVVSRVCLGDVLARSIGGLVDWCVETMPCEPDQQARHAKKAIAHCGVKLYEIMTGGAESRG